MADNGMNPSGRAPVSQRSMAVEASNVAGNKGLVNITIDDVQLDVVTGTTILDAAKAAGIRIPTLCSHEDLCVVGNCRICVVEVEGQKALQAACAYPITSSITVKTQTRAIRMARRHIVDLMLARHVGECYACRRNSNCELQALACEYGVDHIRFDATKTPLFDEDLSSHSVYRDMNKCVLCRRCVRACIDMQEVGVMEAVGKGDKTQIATFFKKPLNDVVCISCGQCIARCPTGALRASDNTEDVWTVIDNPQKHVVMQVSPSTRASIGELFGQDAGTVLSAELNTALTRCGFNKTFDTNLAADLMVIELTSLLLKHMHGVMVSKESGFPQGPLFSSCCAGWVKYIEHFYPQFLEHMAPVKSPQQILGALIKTQYAAQSEMDVKDLVTVALMPCAAQKFESNRPEMEVEGQRPVDFGLTTREMGKMIKEAGVDISVLPPTSYDVPFTIPEDSQVVGISSGVAQAVLFQFVKTVCGSGFTERASQTAFKPVWDLEDIQYAEFTIEKTLSAPLYLQPIMANFGWLMGKTLKIGKCKGTANAKRVIRNIQSNGIFSECHFIEFAACPDGCFGGGGQPIPTSAAKRNARAAAIGKESTPSEQCDFERPLAAMAIYEQLTDVSSLFPSKEELLRTEFLPRGKFIL